MMAAQKGKDLLIKLDITGVGISFKQSRGCVPRRVSFNADPRRCHLASTARAAGASCWPAPA
jgi:predicted secreted protein